METPSQSDIIYVEMNQDVDGSYGSGASPIWLLDLLDTSDSRLEQECLRQRTRWTSILFSSSAADTTFARGNDNLTGRHVDASDGVGETSATRFVSAGSPIAAS